MLALLFPVVVSFIQHTFRAFIHGHGCSFLEKSGRQSVQFLRYVTAVRVLSRRAGDVRRAARCRSATDRHVARRTRWRHSFVFHRADIMSPPSTARRTEYRFYTRHTNALELLQFCNVNYIMYNCFTHTHTRLTALFRGLPRWAGTRKVKPVWILLKQETVSGSGISWAICKSAPCCRQTTTPAPHPSVFYRPDALPTAQPTASKHWRQICITVLYNGNLHVRITVIRMMSEIYFI